RLVGVDISGTQIALARANVPSATFVQADMTVIDRPPASLDAVVAFYSLTHVPRDEHAPLLARIRRWLRPGGVFIASFGVEDGPSRPRPGRRGRPAGATAGTPTRTIRPGSPGSYQARRPSPRERRSVGTRPRWPRSSPRRH